VSSILNALKKLEDENPPKGRSVVWPSGPAPRRIIRRWDITSGWSAVVLWGLLGAVVLASVGGLFFYTLSPSGRDGPGVAPAVQTIVKPIRTPLPSESKDTVASQPPPAVPPPQKTPRSSAPPGNGAPPKTSPAAKNTPAISPEASPPTRRADRSTAAELPVLTELKLQAISWASVPGDRLAVIDGNIMREGAILEGYAIVRIERDAVVVRKGAQQWRLVFNLRQ
jgi:hypothetical protein